MADDDKKRTQEASETDFTTRGGRQDETSGAGKPSSSTSCASPHEIELHVQGAVGTRTYAAL